MPSLIPSPSSKHFPHMSRWCMNPGTAPHRMRSTAPSYLEVFLPSCPQPGHQVLFLGKSSLLPAGSLSPSSAAEVLVQSRKGRFGRDKARCKARLSHLPSCSRGIPPQVTMRHCHLPHRPVARTVTDAWAALALSPPASSWVPGARLCVPMLVPLLDHEALRRQALP